MGSLSDSLRPGAASGGGGWAGGSRAAAPRAPHSAALALPQTRRALWPGMALRPPSEAGPQDKGCYPPDRLQSSPQRLAAYYPPFPSYGHYGNTLTAAEEGFQTFRQLEALSASPALSPFAFRMAPSLLSPGLAVQREPLYDLPWYSKLPSWYPIPHLPREVPHFPNGIREFTGASSEDAGPAGGRSDGGQCWGPEIFVPPPPVDASLFPERPKPSQLLPCSPRERSEDGPKLANQEGKASHRYHFTQEDLHLVLYGVIPSPQNSARRHHAISGLLVPTDSSGKGSPRDPGLGGAGGRREERWGREGAGTLPGGSEAVRVLQRSVCASIRRRSWGWQAHLRDPIGLTA